MIDIKKLKKRGEIDYSEVTVQELVMLKEHFDIVLNGDKEKVLLKTI